MTACGKPFFYDLERACNSDRQERMSPTIHRERGYRFFVFSREEPRIHIPVMCADGESKFWLEPQIELARNFGMTRKQLREAGVIIEEHRDEFTTAWHRHFDH